MSVLECEELPIGDLAFLKQLTESAGPDRVRELVVCAPVAVEHELAAIELAIADASQSALKTACHALKGACYSVQMDRLACITEKMDRLTHDMAAAAETLPALKSICQDSVCWWQQVLTDEQYLP
ncbi:MAG: Hpt domain-containing protein [Sneathiella sp.]|nr:Hpt domain-containing protein [Sneathiella sp.]